MNDSDKDITTANRISAFMRGEMTKEEEAAFLNDIKNDADLRSQAIAMGYLTKAVNEVGEQRDRELRDALMAASEDDVRRIASRVTRRAKIIPLRRRFARIAAIAAIIVVLAIVGYQYYGYRYNVNLAEQYQSEFVNEQTFIRGEESNPDVNKELSSLFANVQKGDNLDSTIARLSLLWELSIQSTYNDYSNYAPLIGWNLAIADLKNNDPDAARSVLEKLTNITKQDSSINAKAHELLIKLK